MQRRCAASRIENERLAAKFAAAGIKRLPARCRPAAAAQASCESYKVVLQRPAVRPQPTSSSRHQPNIEAPGFAAGGGISTSRPGDICAILLVRLSKTHSGKQITDGRSRYGAKNCKIAWTLRPASRPSLIHKRYSQRELWLWRFAASACHESANHGSLRLDDGFGGRNLAGYSRFDSLIRSRRQGTVIPAS